MIPSNSLTDNLIPLLEEYLEETELDTQGTLMIVKALDEIIYQKELAQLKGQGFGIENLKIAAERLQKKSIRIRPIRDLSLYRRMYVSYMTVEVLIKLPSNDHLQIHES